MDGYLVGKSEQEDGSTEDSEGRSEDSEVKDMYDIEELCLVARGYGLRTVYLV